MSKTMYKDIRIQVNVSDPSVQALLDFLDQYPTRQRNRMIVDVLVAHFVGSSSVPQSYFPIQETKQSSVMDNNVMMQRLFDQINRLSEKVEKMESAEKPNMRKGGFGAETEKKDSDKQSEEKEIEKHIPKPPAPDIPEEDPADLPEESIPDVPDAILSFLESMQ